MPPLRHRTINLRWEYLFQTTCTTTVTLPCLAYLKYPKIFKETSHRAEWASTSKLWEEGAPVNSLDLSGEALLGTSWPSGKLVCCAALAPAPPSPSSCSFLQLPPCRLCTATRFVPNLFSTPRASMLKESHHFETILISTKLMFTWELLGHGSVMGLARWHAPTLLERGWWTFQCRAVGKHLQVPSEVAWQDGISCASDMHGKMIEGLLTFRATNTATPAKIATTTTAA